MTYHDRENMNLFMKYCELMGSDLELVDSELLDRLGVCFDVFNKIEQTNEPDQAKDERFNAWDQESRPLFSYLDERISFLCSQGYRARGMLN